MSVKILNEPIEIDNNEILIKLKYELDNFQKHAIYAINRNMNVIVTAHTGSGKTYVAIHAIANALKKNKKIVYCSPIKTLSNEKYKEFREKFGKEFTESTNINASVGILTGDNKISPDANIVVMTTEILRNSLYKLKTQIDDANKELKSNFLEDIGCIIFDEIHYINDLDRGKIWEESLVLIPKEIQIVGLSATIDKPESFAQWLANIKNKDVALIPTIKRPVPLKHYIYANNKLHNIMTEDDKYDSKSYQLAYNLYKEDVKIREKKHKRDINFNLIPELVDFLKKENKLQAIFFSFSRLNCQNYALITNRERNLLTLEEKKTVQHEFNNYMYKYEKQYSMLNQYQELKTLIFNGIAYHHSGIISVLKELIEILFAKGLIKVLFATETLCVGVNLPTRTVVFTELEKFTNGSKRFIGTHEYKQMAGRAGRRGLDTNGTCIILPLYNFPEENALKSILLGNVPQIKSKLQLDYNFFLKVIQSQSTDFTKFMDSSLYFVQHKINIEQLDKKIKIELEEFKKMNDDFNIMKLKLNLDNDDIICKFNHLYEHYNKINTYFGEVSVVLNKNAKKELEKIEKEIKSDNKIYELYIKFSNNQNKLSQIKKMQDELQISSKFVEMTFANIVYFMKDIGFITNVKSNIIDINDKDINLRGVVASHINECNSIILTEMIINNYFDDLTPEEIVGIIAIFINDEKDDDELLLSQIVATDGIYERLEDINKYIDEVRILEKNNNLISNDQYWKLSYNFVDIAYNWACGLSLKECLNDCNMFEGNFIKNMLKINNIIHDLTCLCKLSGNIKILPILEKISPLIMRDIVTVNSLYLS